MSLPHSSVKSRQTFFERKDQEPDANPDGPYWFQGAKALQAQLTAMLGGEQYEAWAELVWPGDSIDGQTWQQIYQATGRALDLAYQGSRDVMALADAAQYPETNPPTCYGLPD